MNTPSVGIGILNWNGKHFLERFLHYLYDVTYTNKTIYVIDNNSTDDSISYLRQNHPSVKIIQTGGNYGVAGGYNIGFGKMTEDFLLMLNSDVEVTPGFLEPMIEKMESDPAVAITQSKLLKYDKKEMFEHGGAAGGMMDILGYSFCRGRIFDSVEMDKNQYGDADIFWAGGACCLIRRSAFVEIGGMYDYLFMHFEEIDMCWRMYSNNYRVVYCKDSVAYHVGGGTLSYQSPRKTYYNFRNNLIMMYRNTNFGYRLWWLPLRMLIDQTAVMHYISTSDYKNAMAVWKGYAGFFKWLIKVKDDVEVKRSLYKVPGVFKGSVVWNFYVKGKKTYQELRK